MNKKLELILRLEQADEIGIDTAVLTEEEVKAVIELIKSGRVYLDGKIIKIVKEKP